MKGVKFLWVPLMILICISAVWLAPEIPFQSNPDAYTLIPEDDRKELEAFQATFNGNGYPMMALVLAKEDGWNSYKDFQQISHATDWWHSDDSLQALSITNVPFPVKTFLGIKKKNFVPMDGQKSFDRWNSKAHLYKDITRKFLSENRKYTLLFVPRQGYSSQKANDFRSAFKQKGFRLLPADYDAIADEIEASNQQETLLLGTLSFAIILLLFFLFTGSLRGLFFIFAMIAFSLSLTALFIYFSGMWFSIHMVAIPCMLIVLSFTDLMHLIYTHHHLRSHVTSNKELRQKLGKSLHRPMLLTSLTNMIGFVLFLVLADSTTMREISILSVVGVFFAFITSRFVAIQLLTKNMHFLRDNTGEHWNQFHTRFVKRWKHRRFLLLSISVGIAVFLTFFLANRSTIDHVPFVKEGQDPAFEATTIMADHFFGDQTASIHLEYNDAEALWNDSSMHYLEEMEEEIHQLLPIKVLSSPTIIAKRYHRFQRNGHPGAFSLPLRYDSLFQKNIGLLGGSDIIKDSQGKARIRFSFNKTNLSSSLNYWEQLHLFIKENPPPKGLTVKLSGTAYYNDITTKNFSQNILLGLMISVFFGALLTFLFVRNWTVFLATLLANSLPLIAALLVMHAFGSELNPISLFFFTVIMGLCVDDSIYLLLHRDTASQGSLYPIAITSVVLAVGFAAFLFSGFDWIRPFGWAFLIGITVAFLFDAFLLALFTDRNSIFEADV